MGSKGINAFKFLLFVCPVLLLLIAVSAKAEYPLSYRTIDGFGNNEVNPEWGNADVPLLRIYTEASYEDGYSAPWVTGLPSARAISNLVNAQDRLRPNRKRVTDFFWQWGQFLDHDIDLTEGATPEEAFDIPVPEGDPWFDPNETGTQTISLNRSTYDSTSGLGHGNPRQQMNQITAFIDASNVYGSDAVRAKSLRTNDGSGCLRTSSGNLLPFNTAGLPNAGGTGPTLFLAGDVRANEQVGLTALHTLFVREHNRLCKKIRKKSPGMSGDEIYEKARAIVGAQMQVITYKEFVPVLLGRRALKPYRGYKPRVNPGISNLFSTAAYRLGHSMLSPQLLRLDKYGRGHICGHLDLRDAFFAPLEITNCGIAPLLRGLASQIAQNIDVYVVDDVRNFLFGPPGAGGFDLASLKIQRGRDHGLPRYNQVRQSLRLPPANDFRDITRDVKVQKKLAVAYDGDVDKVDVWVGGLAEKHRRGALVGELFYRILKKQFENLRDGDRYWYQRTFSGKELRELERTKLSDIIRRNSTIKRIQPEVFLKYRILTQK